MSNSEQEKRELQEFNFEDTIMPHLLSGEVGALLSGDGSAQTPVVQKALFLGPKSENADLVEKLLLQVFRDHVYWRRNFHPEDPPVISHAEQYSKGFLAFWGNFERELFALLGRLKSDIPFFSPRYIGHMLSETSIAGIVGYIAAMLYNPNNVSWEASPVTTLLEIQVGRMLAKMFGFGSTEEELEGTWGHITSGGTVANFESIWVAKGVKFLPIAVRYSARELDLTDLTAGPDNTPVTRMSAWELINLNPVEALDLKDRYLQNYVSAFPEDEKEEALAEAVSILKENTILSMGDHAFFSRLKGKDELNVPIMIVPQTMHYSWEKGPGIFGIGSKQVKRIPIDRYFRTDMILLRRELDRALSKRIPVIQVVGVVGSTEEGAVDPIHTIVKMRNEMRSAGLSFSIHCDAAYGGYMAACFRDRNGALRSLPDMQVDYGGWPSRNIYASFCGMSETDSITVDPHKTGYVPYSAGAIVFRDGRCKELVAQEAPYALGGREKQHPHEIHIGKYIMEGSKAGASAASVFLSSQVIPLNEQGYGKILGRTAANAKTFYNHLLEVADAVGDEFKIVPFFQPDTNIVDYLFNVTGNDKLDVMNRFSLKIYSKLCIDPERPVQTRRFIVSHTEFGYENYNPIVLKQILKEQMGVKPGYFIPADEFISKKAKGKTDGYDDHIFVFRTTLMNPFVVEKVTPDKNYIEMFMHELPVRLKHARTVLKL